MTLYDVVADCGLIQASIEKSTFELTFKSEVDGTLKPDGFVEVKMALPTSPELKL